MFLESYYLFWSRATGDSNEIRLPKGQARVSSLDVFLVFGVCFLVKKARARPPLGPPEEKIKYSMTVAGTGAGAEQLSL